jgi:hypothetical protein
LQRLASTTAFPGTLALSSSDVYWLENAADDPAQISGSVRSVPKGGGTALVVADHQASPTDLVVAGSTPYWATFGTPSGSGAIASTGFQIQLASRHAVSITADASRIYWAEDNGDVQSSTLNGGSIKAFPGASAVALVSDGAVLYTMDNDGGVRGFPEAGGPAALYFQFVKECQPSRTIMLDGTPNFIYFIGACASCETIQRFQVGGTGEAWNLTCDEIMGPAHKMAVDDHAVYWLNLHSVMWAKKDLGPSTVLAQLPCDDGDASHIGGIAVDDTYVYWAAYGGIWRVAKP